LDGIRAFLSDEMILKTIFLVVCIFNVVEGSPKGKAPQDGPFRQILAPGVYYDQERAIPSGVQRPVGRPGGYGSGSKTALRIGDWTAQWSHRDRAWYYYNHNTKVSTWVRPPALRHVIFANPKENELIDRNDNFEDSLEEEDSVDGWLDSLSSTVLNFIPNPWRTNNQLDRNDLTVFGLDLKSGGSLRQAFSDTLKESAMYKNVVKESITFMIKLTAWTLMNWYLYQGAIFTSSALQRSFNKSFGRNFQSSDMEHIKNILKDTGVDSTDAIQSGLSSVLENIGEATKSKESLGKRK